MSRTREGSTSNEEQVKIVTGTIKEKRKKRKKPHAVSPAPASNHEEAEEIVEVAAEVAEQPRKKKKRIHADGTAYNQHSEMQPEENVKQEKKKKRKKIIVDTAMNEEDESELVEIANSQQIPSATFANTMPQRDFSSEDFDFLNINEHVRYSNNSAKIGHAVIAKNNQGEEIALQYAIPAGTNGETPKVRPLINIEAIQRYGMRRFRASTPDNHTPMYATRYIDFELTADGATKEMKIACFSPTHGKEPFWGGKDEEKPLFRGNLKQSVKKELAKEAKEIGVRTKGGTDLVVDHESVRVRDTIKTRKPDQNTVMGESARDAYQAFFESMTDELSSEMKEIFKRALEAPLKNAFKSNFRPEWLHAEGFSLTPMSKNPQQANNLGSAPKWANTEMMVLERIAKWFALNRPNSFIKIKPHFEMLLDSELIKKIKFEVTIEEKNRFIRFLQTIDPFKKFHIFRKASDVAQGTAITHSLLNGVAPVSEQRVVSGGSVITAPVSSSSSAPVVSTPPLAQPVVHAKPSDDHVKNQYPTHLQYEKSVVQILTTSQQPNYDEPWLGTQTSGCSGTGLVISHQGKKYVMTNAHCVENSVVVRVRLANDRKKKFKATRKCVSYQCDLALLEIEDPEFDKIAHPVDFGEMIQLKQKVFTVGFPMGGSEISISKGIVSRVEVRSYCMSGLDMLQVQIDAAVNSGNSGGPVFSDNKVVGITFQGYGMQGLGYMIPIPVMNHFLTEAFSNKNYRGFPILPIVYQTLENPSLRAYYGMKSEQSGVRISKIDYLCDAYHKLQPDDILLEIDGLVISNEATVDVPGIGNCIDFFHVTHMKYIGDSVNLKVLRKNAETKQSEIKLIKVNLDRVPLETEKVSQTEYDKMPTYYIASGISFTPLTRNYLEGKGSDLEECFVLEEACSLADMPKKSEDEQIVVVNDVLDCDETQGYDEYVNAIVKEVNGKSINNIRDVVAAIESNKESTHCIVTGSKKKIVVKNMSAHEHTALLNAYHIHCDRSEDLVSQDQSKEIKHTPPAVIKKLPVVKSSSTTKHKPRSSTAASLHTFAMQVSDDEKEEKHELSLADMTGHKKYLDKLDGMESFYKANALEDEEDLLDDDYEDIEESEASLAASEEEDNEMEDDSDEEVVAVNTQKQKTTTKSNLTKLSDRVRLFKSHRKPSESDDDVPSLNRRHKLG